MLNLPQKGILIAPASLHLSLYQEVLKTHGNTLGLEILSLQSYIQRFFKAEPQTSIDFYFQVRYCCQAIPKENAFYASRSSFAFIQELADFAAEKLDAIQKKYRIFGMAQSPLITDYADNIDTMNFLIESL